MTFLSRENQVFESNQSMYFRRGENVIHYDCLDWVAYKLVLLHSFIREDNEIPKAQLVDILQGRHNVCITGDDANSVDAASLAYWLLGKLIRFKALESAVTNDLQDRVRRGARFNETLERLCVHFHNNRDRNEAKRALLSVVERETIYRIAKNASNPNRESKPIFNTETIENTESVEIVTSQDKEDYLITRTDGLVELEVKRKARRLFISNTVQRG